MICLTTMIYALARELGISEAQAEVMNELERVDQDSLPVVRTIARLRAIDHVGTYIDAGCTSIGRARSRAFHAALASEAEIWICCDDDVEATLQTLQYLVAAVQSSGGICIAPCWIRSGKEEKVANVALLHHERSQGIRELPCGARMVPAIQGGFGLVAIAKPAMLAISYACEDLWFVDDDGETRLAVFHELLADGKWWSEDLSFFRRLPKDIVVEALVSGTTSHDGQILQLQDLLEQPTTTPEGETHVDGTTTST